MTRKPKFRRWLNDLHNPIIGPFQADGLLTTSTILKRENFDFSKDRIFSPLKREMHAQGQPACGILGDRAYIGSGLVQLLCFRQIIVDYFDSNPHASGYR